MKGTGTIPWVLGVGSCGWLGRFLLHHADHELVPVPDLTEEYVRIRVQKDRFLPGYIDDAVEERIQRDLDRQSGAERHRERAATTLLALRRIFSSEIAALAEQLPADRPGLPCNRASPWVSNGAGRRSTN